MAALENGRENFLLQPGRNIGASAAIEEMPPCVHLDTLCRMLAAPSSAYRPFWVSLTEDPTAE